jgi:predicted nucleic acid-binding protein
MKIVVDTNILFSAIISQQSLFRKILFDDTLTLYAPNFAFVELFKYKEKIQKFCKLSDTELYEFMNLLVNRINFVNEQFISDKKPTNYVKK